MYIQRILELRSDKKGVYSDMEIQHGPKLTCRVLTFSVKLLCAYLNISVSQMHCFYDLKKKKIKKNEQKSGGCSNKSRYKRSRDK